MRIFVSLTLFATAVALTAPTAFAESKQYAPPAVIPPPTVLALANSQPKPVQEFDYTPRINRPPSAPQTVTDRQKVVERFRELYGKQNKPRLLLYINRDPFTNQPKDKEKDASTEDKEQAVRRQIMTREIEEAFSLPLQQADVVFVDRQLANLNPDMDSVRKSADLAIELLMEERGFTTDGREVKLPVMTATAIRLSDSQIVARVTSMGLFGLDSHDPNINLTSLMVHMTPSEISQEVAFAMMRELSHVWEK